MFRLNSPHGLSKGTRTPIRVSEHQGPDHLYLMDTVPKQEPRQHRSAAEVRRKRSEQAASHQKAGFYLPYLKARISAERSGLPTLRPDGTQALHRSITFHEWSVTIISANIIQDFSRTKQDISSTQSRLITPIRVSEHQDPDHLYLMDIVPKQSLHQHRSAVEVRRKRSEQAASHQKAGFYLPYLKARISAERSGLPTLRPDGTQSLHRSITFHEWSVTIISANIIQDFSRTKQDISPTQTSLRYFLRQYGKTGLPTAT